MRREMLWLQDNETNDEPRQPRDAGKRVSELGPSRVLAFASEE